MSTEIRKYTKKPVTIEAVQFTGGAENATSILKWILTGEHEASWDEAYDAWDSEKKEYYEVPEAISINTLEGTMTCSVGDWVIRGVKGEFYPCKPDIFEELYNPELQIHFDQSNNRPFHPPTYLEN